MTFQPPAPVPEKPVDRSAAALARVTAEHEDAWEDADRALAYLAEDPRQGGLDLPWTVLRTIVGPLRQHYLVLLGADTGNGKTSVVMHLLHEWQRAGKRVYVVSLEIDPYLLRLYWACLHVGVDPRPVIQEGERGIPAGRVEDVKAHVTWQALSHDAQRRVQFSTWRRLAMGDLRAMMFDAKSRGADVILLDHLHEIDIDGPEARGNSYDRWVLCCRMLKELIREYQVPVVAAAQFHRDKGFDRLAAYLPPRETAFQGGHKLLQVADIAIGLYRPLTTLITKGEMVKLRSGLLNVRDYISKGIIGCNILKHRYADQRGQICQLTYVNGHISEQVNHVVAEGGAELGHAPALG